MKEKEELTLTAEQAGVLLVLIGSLMFISGVLVAIGGLLPIILGVFLAVLGGVIGVAVLFDDAGLENGEGLEILKDKKEEELKRHKTTMESLELIFNTTLVEEKERILNDDERKRKILNNEYKF